MSLLRCMLVDKLKDITSQCSVARTEACFLWSGQMLWWRQMGRTVMSRQKSWSAQVDLSLGSNAVYAANSCSHTTASPDVVWQKVSQDKALLPSCKFQQ